MHPEIVAMTDLKEKAEEIDQLLKESPVDLWKLRELALSEGGLVNGKHTAYLLAIERLVH